MFNTFLRECYRNFFFWWGLIMWILTTFSSFSIFNLVLQAIVLYQLYVPILFIAITLTFITTIIPISQRLKKLLKELPKIKRFLIIGTICLLLYADGIYFMIDPQLIFAVLFSESISDHEKLDYAKNVKILANFLVFPLMYTIFMTFINNSLKDKRFDIKDGLKNNRVYVLYVIVINTIATLLVFLIAHLQS